MPRVGVWLEVLIVIVLIFPVSIMERGKEVVRSEIHLVIDHIIDCAGANFLTGVSDLSPVDDVLGRRFSELSEHQTNALISFARTRDYRASIVSKIYENMNHEALVLLQRIYSLDCDLIPHVLTRLVVCVMIGFVGYFYDTPQFDIFTSFCGPDNKHFASRFGRAIKGSPAPHSLLALDHACLSNCYGSLAGPGHLRRRIVKPFNYFELDIFKRIRKAVYGFSPPGRADIFWSSL